jgi:Ferritin-like domain
MEGYQQPDDGVSRRQLLGLIGSSGAVVALLAACGSDSGSQGGAAEFGGGEVGSLNYLLTLEHVQASLYAAALKSGLFDGPGSETAYKRNTIRKFGAEEIEHVTALTKVVERLGGEPVDEPETKFSSKAPRSLLTLASSLENLCAAAYLGQIPGLSNPSALETVLAIHTVEGRHAASIDAFLSKPMTPDGAFAKPATSRAVLRSVEPLIVD